MLGDFLYKIILMKKLLVLLFFVFTVSSSFAKQFDDSSDFCLQPGNISEISAQIKQETYKEFKRKYPQNADLVTLAQKFIYNYYGKKTFEEPEWIRVKNFLTWLDKNKDSLNSGFIDYLRYFRSFRVFNKFSYIEKQAFIGAYLGANYLTENVTGKKFELQIFLRNRCCIYQYGGICIYPQDIISAINGAIHEATHILPVNEKNFLGQDIEEVNILSEQATIFAQLKYALPLKIDDDNILSGARANFKFADKEFVERYIDPLLREYKEVAPAVTEYSQYLTEISNILELKHTKAMSVGGFLSKLLYYRALSEYVEERELTDIESKLAATPVYKDTLDEIYDTIYADSINKLEIKSIKTIDFLAFQLFEGNRVPIAMIFYKNLKKYADKNIPPVPENYI